MNSPKKTVPPLLKVCDVARMLSVSRQTVHNLIDSGDLEGSEIGSTATERKHLRITQASLCKYYKKRFGHSLLDALAHRPEL